ncbi:SDR family oxidoreductase [Lentzea albidocapillata]|uniref:NADP-dependent 3-hydroxy acid dehydrogenase YdfG n=1 Tax=Lentzea albidocapillata TaxID=40571 RepID=A0A1W2FD09_9PSEU|nr:SDR family NAD(P)-dependent oxidoreductase [Lentzea albidocapillata]SMD19865.1 NADP-dependent 3-hydroxy acid dehydrogenase YdfG [Lentzea albidocapillata]
MNVVITGGGRGFGRTIARRFAEQGATVVVTARDLVAAQRTRDLLTDAHAVQCDLTDPASVRRCAAQAGELLGHVDVLVNNGAAFLAESQVDDDAIVRTILSGTAGTVLMTESFLPLLRRSERPDVVTLVSLEAESRSDPAHIAHAAFHAAKAGQGRYAEIMSQRLRPEGIRMIALYPPDFDNSDDAARDGMLTARSVADCVLFAVNQPRDCFIRSFHFEPMPR